MHDLNDTLNMLASCGDKTLEQLIVCTFSWKRHLELSILKSIMLISLLFHYMKIMKIAYKVKIENCLFISKYTINKLPSIFTNWLTFSLMSHNHQTFPSMGYLEFLSVQTYGKRCFCLYGYKNLEWYSERNEGCDVEHVFTSSVNIIAYWILFEYVQKILKLLVVPILLKIILYSTGDWFLTVSGA